MTMKTSTDTDRALSISRESNQDHRFSQEKGEAWILNRSRSRSMSLSSASASSAFQPEADSELLSNTAKTESQQLCYDNLMMPQQNLNQQEQDQHNLIPLHLQQAAMGLASLAGTPGHPPALISAPNSLSLTLSLPQTLALELQQQQQPQQQVFTVQDRPLQSPPPVYNGVNPAYPGLRILSTSPPIFCVDQFLSSYECDFLIQHAQDSFGPAPVVGKGAGEVSPSRTSSTCYLAREDLPSVMQKVSMLTGKPVEHCELPQVGRYFPTEQYLQHYDAFDLSTEDGRRFAENGGQRTITVLIYLNTVHQGGATRFPALPLDVQPVRGMALVFFPATVDGMLDKMALHAALPAIDTKYVSQVWIRQSTYQGQPSKRLPVALAAPFGQEDLQQQMCLQRQHHYHLQPPPLLQAPHTQPSLHPSTALQASYPTSFHLETFQQLQLQHQQVQQQQQQQQQQQPFTTINNNFLPTTNNYYGHAPQPEHPPQQCKPLPFGFATVPKF